MALSNAQTSGDGKEAPCIENVFDGNSSFNNCKYGESVDYAHSPENQWFVIRSTFGRAKTAYDLLSSEGFHAFLPVKVVEKVKNNSIVRDLKPLIPNMLFVYSDNTTIKEFIKENKGSGILSFYYNHFEKESTGTDKLLTIPTWQMDSFILTTRVRNQHTMLVDPSKLNFKSGDIVRILEGDFAGVVGKVARIKGQKRVVVVLEGVCAVATAYIPSAFIEPYNTPSELFTRL